MNKLHSIFKQIQKLIKPSFFISLFFLLFQGNLYAATTITSNGGGSTASISLVEGTTAVTTVIATKTKGNAIVYSITGGSDSSDFTIGSSSGELIFNITPDYANPHDSDTNNIYVVTVKAANNQGSDTQTITVTVTSNGLGNSGDNFREFTLQHNFIIYGDMQVIGNSIMLAPGGTCAGAGINNSSINMEFADKDSDTNTFNSTMAELVLPAGVDANDIRYAGLHWQGRFINNNNSSMPSNAQTVKLKFPSQSSYTTVTSATSKFNYGFDTAPGYGPYNDYQGIADITNAVKAEIALTSDTTLNNTGYTGDIWVADIQADTSNNSFGAWALVIVYDDPISSKLRSISIYDGFKTTVQGGTIASTLLGFRTPKTEPVDAKFLIFGGEGDIGRSDSVTLTNKSNTAISLGSNVFNSTVSINGTNVTNRNPACTNTIGVDIDTFSVGIPNGSPQIIGTDQDETIVSITEPNDSTWDQIFPGLYAFSTEIYVPRLCYDYAYKQNDQYFTEDNNGSFTPNLIGSGLTTTDPVTVEFFFKNTEISDILFQNVSLSFTDINTSQVTYVPNSTYIINPNKVFPEQYNTLTNIPIDDIDSQDFFFADYSLTPLSSDIYMPLNATLTYDVVLTDSTGTDTTIPYTIDMDAMPLCSSLNFAYLPSYGNFNVENSILAQSQKYNLPTQTAGRAGDFVITSYDPVNTNTRKGISTAVAIDLIDAGKYHGIDASCSEPDSALTPRIWLIFDNNQSSIPFDADTITTAIANGTISDQISGAGTAISSAAEFYKNARENTAFRVSFNKAGEDGDVIQLVDGTCQGQQIPPCVEVLNFPDLSQVDLGNGAGRCVQDIDGNPNNTDTIPQNCGNAGNAGMDSVQLAVCMECLYGYNIDFYCSRDNFATRPESFRMHLNDQDQNDKTQQSNITTNNDTTIVHDTSSASTSALQIVAGYDYALEINASNYQNDNNTPGYYASFLEDGEDGDRSIKLNWETSTDDTKCNDIEDHNQTATFFNGTAALDLNSPQIGKYTLTLLDRLWTRVDHDPDYMTHHTTGSNAAYFITTSDSDCIGGSSVVPIENAYTTTYVADVSGCDITTAYNDPSNDSLSYHLNTNTNSVYTDIALRIHPYQFNVGGLTIGSRPSNDGSNNTFVYINTLDESLYLNDIDENMSYNIQDTFFAAGYDGNTVSNYVDQCYAEGINMTLKHTYLSDIPATTDNLTYDLIDFNTTNPSISYPNNDADTDRNQVTFTETLVKNVNTDLIIAQATNVFNKDMKGAITMDLGYNFARTNNVPLNPRKINFSDFNITYSTQPADTVNVYADLRTDHEIFGNRQIDTNVTFVYARAKPNKFFYDDVTAGSILTPISILAYCDLGLTECQNRGLTTLVTGLVNDAQSNESSWWYSQNHSTAANADGQVTLTASGGGTVNPTDPTSITTTSGIDNSVTVTNTGGTPNVVNIDFGANTNRWLIYNKNAITTPSPFYRVRFIGTSGWTGHGKTGNVVGDDINQKKSRRVE